MYTWTASYKGTALNLIFLWLHYPRHIRLSVKSPCSSFFVLGIYGDVFTKLLGEWYHPEKKRLWPSGHHPGIRVLTHKSLDWFKGKLKPETPTNFIGFRWWFSLQPIQWYNPEAFRNLESKWAQVQMSMTTWWSGQRAMNFEGRFAPNHSMTAQ